MCPRASAWGAAWGAVDMSVLGRLGALRTRIGFLPNIFKVLSHRPSEFRAFSACYNAIYNKETGQLSKTDKELIIVVTSLPGKCLYNVVVHSALYRVYSKDPVLSDQVCINWRKSDLPAREKAMLEFALAVTQVEEITDDHFTKLQVHGFSREDAWDIATIAAFYAMANRLAHFISIIPNREFYTVGRTSSANNKKNELDSPQA
uniref:uncharacterized protein LOC123453326 n=1 Tax=Jaculus jaculus TaxID=51337 RepID=UPI001E1B3743|nr:uncharacterized protein LOC123453326 [Jaculus jaculus]